MKENNESITFEEFHDIVVSIYDKNKEFLRLGQTLMNYLFIYWKEEYNRIKGSAIDCFTIDKRIGETLKHLKTVWFLRDGEIYNRKESSIDRRRNKVFLEINSEMSLLEFAGFITKHTKLEDLPQLIALVVKIVNNDELSIPLINHFEHLKNENYQHLQNINKPSNLLNYEIPRHN